MSTNPEVPKGEWAEVGNKTQLQDEFNKLWNKKTDFNQK